MSPGLFVPTLITLKHDFDGKFQSAYKTVVSNILCNRHDPRNFVKQLSNNMLVADSISKTAYKIDANGRKSSVEKPMYKYRPPSSVPSGTHTGDTVAESARPRTGWVNAWTITSLVVLIGAGIVIYYRRKKK